MIKSYIEEIQDFLNLIDNGYLENVNINNNSFIDYYNKYWRYKNLAKILHLRCLDKELRETIYNIFNDKIEHLKHIRNEQEYQIELSNFINDNLNYIEEEFYLIKNNL